MFTKLLLTFALLAVSFASLDGPVVTVNNDQPIPETAIAHQEDSSVTSVSSDDDTLVKNETVIEEHIDTVNRTEMPEAKFSPVSSTLSPVVPSVSVDSPSDTKTVNDGTQMNTIDATSAPHADDTPIDDNTSTHPSVSSSPYLSCSLISSLIVCVIVSLFRV